MRVFAVSLRLLMLSSLTVPGGALAGQAPDADCLTPMPHPGTLALPPQGARTGSKEERASSSPFFVTSDGALCQSFHMAWENRWDKQVTTDRTPLPGKAFLLSAALPGAGQWSLGLDRWPAYLAVEAWAWIQFLDWREKGHRLQDDYKDLAWLVARRVSTGRRTEAGWDYYEALTQFPSSGAYDSDPLTPGVQPEEDPETFNGYIWTLAKEIYLPEDPGNPVNEEGEPFQDALLYYTSRAYAPQLAWEWGANTLHQREYASLIEEADEALRRSTGMIGVILANHLLSAVDALVSGRLGIAEESEPSMEVFLVPGSYYTQEVVLRVRLPDPFFHEP